MTFPFQTLEFWPYSSNHWNCNLIISGTGMLPYPSKYWNFNLRTAEVTTAFFYLEVATNIRLNKDQPLSFYRNHAHVLQTQSYAIYHAQNVPLHYSFPKGRNLLTVTSSNKNQISLLTKTLESLTHWKNEQFPCSILALFSNFGFSVVMGSLSSNIFKWSDLCCRLFRIHLT